MNKIVFAIANLTFHTFYRALAALERVGILEQAYQRASTLSGGQQQRVAIARCLVQDAKIILADEPIASLDLSFLKGNDLTITFWLRN